jgi:tetratricopeptide (TPR) repeat protein
MTGMCFVGCKPLLFGTVSFRKNDMPMRQASGMIKRISGRGYNYDVHPVQHGVAHDRWRVPFTPGKFHRHGPCHCARVWAVVLIALCAASRSSAQTKTYADAEALVRNHRWDEGLALVQSLLKQDPNNARELNLAGLALTGKGDTTQANEYFRKCLRVDTHFVPALKNLAINEYNQSDLSGAEKHLHAAAEQIPDDPVVNLYLGEIAYRQHQYKEAAASLARAPQFVAHNNDVAAHLAVSYLQIGEKQKAFEMLERLSPDQISDPAAFSIGIALAQLDMPTKAAPFLAAVQHRQPDSYDIGFDLTLVSIMAKDYTGAIRTATDLIAKGHETAELDNVLAESYEADNQTQKAVDTLRRAIEIDPQDETNYLDFATLCMNHRSYDAAMKVLEVGLQVHPQSESLTFMRGVLYGMQDEYDLAEKDFQKATALAPQNNLGAVGLGVTYLEKGNAAHAITVLRERLQQNPNDASLLYLLAEAMLRNGAVAGTQEYKEAQDSLEKSVHWNPNLCLPHVSLGSIYLDENRFPEAVSQLEQARAIDPTERSAYSHLAVAYRRMGQPDKSREVLNALKEMIERERRNTREKMKAESERSATPTLEVPAK